MGRRYCQLHLSERRRIWRLLGYGFSVREVLEKLGRHVSTIYRELQRNRFVGGDPVCKFERYYPVTANDMAAEREARQAKLMRYPSLQKGAARTTNRRLRRFLPSNTNVAALPEQAFDRVANQLNRTPRKCLGYQTPEKVLREAIAEAVNGN